MFILEIIHINQIILISIFDKKKDILLASNINTEYFVKKRREGSELSLFGKLSKIAVKFLSDIISKYKVRTFTNPQDQI